jgi:hypothetical protein
MQHRAARTSCAGAQVLFAHPVVSSSYAVSSFQAHINVQKTERIYSVKYDTSLGLIV